MYHSLKYSPTSATSQAPRAEFLVKGHMVGGEFIVDAIYLMTKTAEAKEAVQAFLATQPQALRVQFSVVRGR